MTVAHILKNKGTQVHSVSGDDTVLKALNVLAENGIGAVLVKSPQGAIAGILSERDIVRALPNAAGKLREQPVSSIMTKRVITCRESDSIDDVMAVMTKNKIRHLPVMDGKRLLGVISIGDVVKARISEAEHEAEALKQYIVSG